MTANKPSILFYNFGAKFGGAENVLLTFLENPSGDVNYRVLLHEYGRFYDKLKAINIPVDVIQTKASSFYALKHEAGWGLSLFSVLPLAIKLFFQTVAYFKRHDFKLIVSNTYKSHLIAGLAGDLYGFKVVWRFHDILQQTYPYNQFSNMNILLLKFSAQGVRQISGVSRAVTRSLEAYGFETAKLSVIHNGLDMVPSERNHVQDPHCLSLGWIGQFTPWKGIEEFIVLCKKLIDRQAEFPKPLHITIAGSALFGSQEYEQKIRDLVTDPYASAFTFLGHITDVDAFYKGLDIYFHTSLAPDPFPTSILEAGSRGLLVVASKLGGAPEIIRDSETGFLINMAENETTLRRVGEIISQFDEHKNMGSELKKHIGKRLNAARYRQAFAASLLDLL